jgi:hypothetical protein
MFRHVPSPFKCSSTLKTHHSFYATLPQLLPTAVHPDGPSPRRRPVDDLSSVEKKSRKRGDKEDPSMSLYFFEGDHGLE